jgi:CBS domain-containing protein
MLISLISQYKNQIPSFCAMPVKQLMTFLLPHRLVTVEETAITAEAYAAMVKERVSGCAVVNDRGVLVDTLSARDLRCIGSGGGEFERMWMIVREFKETARQLFKEVTPARQHWVSQEDRMIDIISGMSDGNLHRSKFQSTAYERRACGAYITKCS